MRLKLANCKCIDKWLLRMLFQMGGANSMSLARGGMPLQMRIVTVANPVQGSVFGNFLGQHANCSGKDQQDGTARVGAGEGYKLIPKRCRLISSCPNRRRPVRKQE